MYKSYFNQVEQILAEAISANKKVEKISILTDLMKNIAQTAPDHAGDVEVIKTIENPSPMPTRPVGPLTQPQSQNSSDHQVHAPTAEDIKAEPAISSSPLKMPTMGTPKDGVARTDISDLMSMRAKTTKLVKNRNKK